MRVGQVVSHYRVLEKIGEGGLGEVFLAEDMILNRRVALKVLTAARQADRHEQILAEARSAASIDHPHACKVYETVDFEGTPFIVMEFVEGETLAQRLRSGPMLLNESVKIATEIIEALSEAHEKSIIHCDLKPSNIMITRSGHAKLMDFGLAKPARQRPIPKDDSTQAIEMPVGALTGTPAYMAPEQVRGEKPNVRWDIFAFGIVLYEMLSGKHPFRRRTAEATMGSIVHEDAPSIREAAPAIPASLAQIIQRALSKSADGRYASARELYRALTGADDISVPAVLRASIPAVAIMPFTDLSPARPGILL